MTGRTVRAVPPSERILEAVAYAAQRLLRSTDHGAAIGDVLERLGVAADVSRAYIFEVVETDDEMIARQRWEWVAPGITPEIDNPDMQHLAMRAQGFGSWFDAWAEGDAVAGDVETFAPEVTAILAEQDIRSLAVVPIVVDTGMWGFIGFDECQRQRTWTTQDIEALRTAADVLAAALHQDAARRVLQASERAYAAAYEREREAAERLRVLDGMKDAFLEAVSHELRTPLTAVVGFAQTLGRLGLVSDRDGGADILHGLVDNAERLGRILEDLLDLGHLTRGVLHPERGEVDVRAVVEGVLGDLNGRAGAHPVLVTVEIPTAWVDEAKVERIIANLAHNAVRHTPPGTPVWIRAWRAEEALQLAVEDAGPGVPDDHKARVFEPFQVGPDASRHAPGTGVGLSVVARYALLHGGDAWIEDRPGGGARVRVRLPEERSGS